MKSLIALLLAANAFAADTGSWQNLASLRSGQPIGVRIKSGNVKGAFVRFDDQGITVRDKKGEHAVQRADVQRVALPKRSRAIWIGAAVGGGGGAAVGAGLGGGLGNESGGDFDSLKGPIIGACAVIGALVGAAVGASVRRTTVIYLR